MDTIKKFQDLLKRLFQFETSDLDFGIYRILNYKREQIEKFIQEDLKNKVESTFAKHKGERLTNINQRFKEAKQKVIQGLGAQAFTPTGELKEEFKDTPLGRDFLSINAQKDEAETIDEIKLQVFNDLYNFFSRYYEEGDFAPQYRHSIKGHKYAIPYNGEEVKLYWANNEQYYTKTGLLFRDYTFKANEYKGIFRITSAREELGSKKATKARFFTLDDENPTKAEDKDLIIRFQYRELTEEEVRSYGVEGGSNAAKQEKINQKTYDEVLKKIKDIELKAPLAKDYKSEKPLLLYQISRFTAKNTKDYFIHKNLRRFLSEQLDYFIKAEVLDIETLEKERFLDKHITRARVVREIGEDIIDFLCQIEDFQKKLWEKKKFVLKTEYVITTDRVPEEFYGDIWNNKDQKNEWTDLEFEIPKTKDELKNKKLPIDTKYFSQEFRGKLLEKLTSPSVIARDEVPKQSLDDLLDGILIKSENWQALNLILRKYRESVKCIYIDPPYNTGNDEFLYRDRYQHSSWLSMIIDRLTIGNQMLSNDGVMFISIDDNEFELLGILIRSIFEKERFIGNLVWEKKKKGAFLSKHITNIKEYIFLIAKSFDDFRGLIGEISNEMETYPCINASNPRDIRVIPPGIQSKFREKNYRLEKGAIITSGNMNMVLHSDLVIENSVLAKELIIDGNWRYQQDKFDEYAKNGSLYITQDLYLRRIVKDTRLKTLKDLLPRVGEQKEQDFRGIRIDNLFVDGWGSNEDANDELMHLMGAQYIYDYPKPSKLIAKLIASSRNTAGIHLDFFAGSGTTAHAVMKLNKEDGGKRKFILVEMADYFDTVIIPRIKKVAYSFNWKDGKSQDTDGIGIFFKYQILEQYEDTLDNIELTSNKQAELKFGNDYLLKYFLDYETRENPSLLNIEQLKSPFSYKLKVNLEEVGEPEEMIVDIPETFNYLLGLKVKKIKAREIASPLARNDNKRKYLFVLGEKEGKDIAIVWREYDDNWNGDDFKEDKEFVIKELEPWAPYVVYVNGQSVLTPKLGNHTVEIHYIEPEFINLMG